MPAAVATALIVIDPQVSFCDAHGSMARQGRPIETMRAAAETCGRLADTARESGAMIIWTRMVFAPDYSDGGELTATIRPGLARIGALRRGSGDECLSDVVHPQPEDIVLDKTRYSALIGTDLEAILRDKGIERVLVCGVTTSMCVESTVRDLGQRDFKTFFVTDACADFDQVRHEASLASMAFGFAKPLSLAEAEHLLNGQDLAIGMSK
jgi:nicotinamidase-related amidase